jgi:hypothetical protein
MFFHMCVISKKTRTLRNVSTLAEFTYLSNQLFKTIHKKFFAFIPLSLGAAFGILFFRNWVAWDQHSLQPLKLPLEGTEAGTHTLC